MLSQASWEFKEILSDPSELIIGLIVDDCGFIMPHVKAFAAKISWKDRIEKNAAATQKYLEIGLPS